MRKGLIIVSTMEGMIRIWLCGILLSCAVVSTSQTDGDCDWPRPQPHSRVRLSHQGRRVTYSCEPGYSLVGNMYDECRDGRWMYTPPLCVGQRCPYVLQTEHSTQVYSYGRGFIRFECEPGYSLSGPSVLACMGSEWNGTQPKCKDDTEYLTSGRGHNRGHSKWNTRGRSHRDWLKDADYSCIQNGVSISPPSIEHAMPVTRWARVHGKPRLYAVYRCMWGYEDQLNRDIGYMYCKDKDWTGEALDCRDHEPPASVSYTQRDQPPRKKAPRVPTHQEMLGLADFTCLGRHSSTPVPRVEHAIGQLRHVIIETKPRLYVQYACDDGFKVQGSEYVYCRDASWTGDPPVCVEESDESAATPGSPCAVKNGGCDHVCDIQDGVKRCACLSGYKLNSDGHSCSKIYNKRWPYYGHRLRGEKIPPLMMFKKGYFSS